MGHTDTGGESDATLVRRVLDGEVETYAALVARYRDRLGRYALHRLGNRADAEDAVQETLVRAYRGLERCAAPERFGAWVFQILVNRCRTGRGGRSAHRRRPGLGRGDSLGAGPADPGAAGGVPAEARGGTELRG